MCEIISNLKKVVKAIDFIQSTKLLFELMRGRKNLTA